MPIPTRARRAATLLAALALAVGCDNQVTQPPPPPPSPIAPHDPASLGKAPFKSVVALEPLIGSGGIGFGSFATDINDLGQVVGQSGTASSSSHAVIWDNSTIPQDLGALAGGDYSSAAAISNDGRVIVGSANDASNGNAVRWLRVSGQWTIDRLSAGTNCYANSVSSDGAIIGGECGSNAVVWVNGLRIILGAGFLADVNKNMQAVGSNPTFDHAILWNFSTNPVTATDLGSLGTGYAVAQGINDAGEVTGWSANTDNVSHAFFWSSRRGMVDLGETGTSPQGGGYDVNATGQVVGDLWPGGIQHAAYYAGGKTVDLGVLPGYNTAVALSINANGQIVGVSAGGQSRATMWLLK